MNSFLCSIMISIGLLLVIKSDNTIKGGSNMLNIYNNKLEPCGNKNMSNGSWDENKMCSEKTGGVHQICIENIAKKTPNFSSSTGQSDWSDKRNNNNHCVCLGAWSLYNKKINDKLKKTNTKNNKKKTKKVLKCNSIPKISLSDEYVSNFSEGWNKWNGLELKDQIIDGVESMVSNCLYKKKNKKNITKNKNLINNYCKFSKNHKVLNETDFYKKYCKNKL